MLKGKHIILGITGSIAAYKAAYLLRLLIKRGAEVQVVMTPSGKEFITPVTLSSLSGKPVVSEFFTANTGEWHSHVDLGLWADALLIAPATAATIGKMANGIADNMLVTTYLSCKAPVFVAPAMDLDMYAHASTQRNLDMLRSYGNHIIEPATGELASHLTGKGRMEEPEKIVEILDRFFETSKPLSGKKVLITAGPTYEKIDPVRFIGNYSSGRLKTNHSSIDRIDVESAEEMYRAVLSEYDRSDIAIMCAAVADYAPETVSDVKLKRTGEDRILRLRPNPDIAAELGRRKRPGQCLVGFALETNDEEMNARLKMEKKNLDFIVLNSFRDAGAGFQCDTNKVTVIGKQGEPVEIPCKPKIEVAADIVDIIGRYVLEDR